MAKADIKASSKGISTSADRGSGSEPKWERSTRKRLSAERSLRTSPGVRAMVSHFLDPSGKIGSSGDHYAGWIREMGDQKQRLFKGKTPGRELLHRLQGTLHHEGVPRHRARPHSGGRGHDPGLPGAGPGGGR